MKRRAERINITADRTEATIGRRRKAKLIVDGGTTPHLGTCDCGAVVVFHRQVGGATVKLEETDALAPAGDGRFVIFQGVAISDPDPRNVPGFQPYREHVCQEIHHGA